MICWPPAGACKTHERVKRLGQNYLVELGCLWNEGYFIFHGISYEKELAKKQCEVEKTKQGLSVQL